jgi:CubicO group peptidase (beta-lactamase class C family)
VRDAFAGNFAEHGEVGAAVCVIRHGEVLVHLWGGWADAERSRPWASDTVAGYYSAGKAVLATLVLQLVDRGELTLDTPVAEVWPEFAVHDKHTVTIAHALSHQAAVPAIRAILTGEDLLDWHTMTAALAATEPWWPIGTRHGYHTNTYGHLLGEIVRRVTGDTPRTAVQRLAAEAAAELWVGVPVDLHPRCADVIWAPASDIPPFEFSKLSGDTLMNALAHFNPPGYSSVGLVNTAAWRSAEVPSTNGHGTAHGLARLYAALLEPGRLVSPDLLAEATKPASHGPCPILGDDVTFGLGFTPTTARRPLGPNPHAFGHFGTGGALRTGVRSE